jgi:hypothetical protein
MDIEISSNLVIPGAIFDSSSETTTTTTTATIASLHPVPSQMDPSTPMVSTCDITHPNEGDVTTSLTNYKPSHRFHITTINQC